MTGIWEALILSLWCVTLLLMVVVLGILRHLAIVREKWAEGILPVTKYQRDDRIEDIVLTGAEGVQLSLLQVLKGASSEAILIVASMTCPACKELFRQISELFARQNFVPMRRIIVAITGDSGPMRERIPLPDSAHLTALFDKANEFRKTFSIHSVPTALTVTAGGRLLHQTANPAVAHWLYNALDVPPPTVPLTHEPLPVVLPKRIVNVQ